MPIAAYGTIWLSLNPGVPGQWHLHRALTVVLALVSTVTIFDVWKDLGRSSRIAVALCMLVTLESIFWLPAETTDARRAFAQAVGALGASSVILVIAGSQRRLVHLLRGLVLAALVISAVALVEWRTGLHLETLAGRPWPTGAALGATFVNPNNFAAHTVVLVGVLLVTAHARSGWGRLLLFSGLLLGALSLLTFSRTALLALALTGTVLISLRARGRFSEIVPKVVILALLAVIAAMATNFLDHFSEGVYFDGSSQSNQLRLEIAKRAILALIQSVGFGIGPGAFEASQSVSGNVLTITNIHNSFLEVAVAYGAVPAALLLLLVFTVLKSAWQGLGTHPSLAALSLFALGSALLGGLTASSILADPGWWLELALAAVLADVASSSEASGES
ncbi:MULTISPECIES: O-antigen ligase family protein [unclassified Luteococcus]|uniref:O-antigen ligase family protein n=1 Tax=unclassified Luteococcus TaxID=2639923 RepID=UPI00313C0456